MTATRREERFLLYQIKAIRRFQRLRQPRSPEEAQRLALEWIRRFAGSARVRWNAHTDRHAPALQRWAAPGSAPWSR